MAHFKDTSMIYEIRPTDVYTHTLDTELPKMEKI